MMTASASLLLVVCSLLQSQVPDLNRLVRLAESGQGAQVREDIPRLLEKYPNDPGLLYLDALLMADGREAVRRYQSIIDNFPRSEWADDALFRVYQFYYALGLYRTAEMKLEQLRTQYPDSPHLRKSADIPPAALAEDPASVLDSAAAVPAPTYTLQVGAFAVRENAEKQRSLLEELRYDVEIKSKVKEGVSLFTVLVGSYPTVESARSEADVLRTRHRISSMVVVR